MKKKVLLTGINGTVAQALKRQLSERYDITGISVARMDSVIDRIGTLPEPTWRAQLQAYGQQVMEQLTSALHGVDAVAHLGWNTRDEHCGAGLDPLNIFVVDCVYRAAIAEKIPRIYMASSVHAYDFPRFYQQDVEPVKPFPDVRQDPFGVPPTSLYGVSKRWMEIAGQYYANQLHDGQKILVVRLGAVNGNGLPYRPGSRLWNSHQDLGGLLTAFIECENAPRFWVSFGVSNNHGGAFTQPLFDPVNPYGFEPGGNAFEVDMPDRT